MFKHVFFDLDKTLTTSRSPMLPEHQELFDNLCSQRDVVVVSGGTEKQIREQVTSRFDNRYYMLAQSGNHCVDKAGTVVWYEPLTARQTAEILAFTEKLKKHFRVNVEGRADVIDHRGAQIGYSVIGYDAAIEEKYAFDPGDVKRAAALATFPIDLKRLSEYDIEVTPAGTTSFNFIKKGSHKGYNIARFITQMDWKKEECVYVGDALFPGGNDESVIGVIPTQSVKDPDECFSFIQRNLLD